MSLVIPAGREAAAIADEWRRRAAGEYASAAIAAEFAWWLARAGAPPALFAGAQRVALDELDHAKLAQDVVRELGHDPDIDVATSAMKLPEIDDDLIASIAEAAVRTYALSETLAIALFRLLRGSATAPAAIAFLDRTLRDEPIHAALGWQVLDWLLQRPEVVTLRPRIRTAAADGLAALARLYGVGCTHDPAPEASLQWGVAGHAEFGPVVAACARREVVRRFDIIGIDMRAEVEAALDALTPHSS